MVFVFDTVADMRLIDCIIHIITICKVILIVFVFVNNCYSIFVLKFYYAVITVESGVLRDLQGNSV